MSVPGWRLLLSRGATALYRRVFRNQLSSYTSCFRIYRRAALAGLVLPVEADDADAPGALGPVHGLHAIARQVQHGGDGAPGF